MAVYQLTEDLIFPHPGLGNGDGLLAIGGDLSIDRLLLAYSNGIFPWYDEVSPIMWWSPNPRMILFPNKFKISKSLLQTVRNKGFKVSFDKNFDEVIKNCAELPRPGQSGTWITPEMQKAYIELHNEGFAHSVETWHDDRLVGGLYGISIGRVFFGESMFFTERDASKVAFYYLVERLKTWDFEVIDAQQDTLHMRRMGAELVKLDAFLELLKKSIQHPTIGGKWS